MTLRSRKLIGTFALPVWIAVYSLVIMVVGGRYAVGGGMVLEMAFYAMAGIAWLPVAMWIIKWMSKEA
jgi:Protein of unknown function (DUF2842)